MSIKDGIIMNAEFSDGELRQVIVDEEKNGAIGEVEWIF